MHPKPPYNPALHHRRSIRLAGYDYAQAGLYFITLCVQHRHGLFGHVAAGEMTGNDAGRMIETWYVKLETKFPDIRCDAHVVMPNHFHCIIQNTGAGVPAGAPSGHSSVSDIDAAGSGASRGERHDIASGEHAGSILGEHHNNILGEHMGSPLRRVVQWFKTMTTNDYIRNVKTNGWPRFDGRLWQRNYYEHIIRNEKSYNAIADYIRNNPAQWQCDRLNPNNQKNNIR